MVLYGSHLENPHVALARAIRNTDLPTELKTLAVGDAGAIPYFSEWLTIDFTSQNGKNLKIERYGFAPEALITEYKEIACIKMFPRYFTGVFVRRDLAASIRAVAQSADRKNAEADNRVGVISYFRRRLDIL